MNKVVKYLGDGFAHLTSDNYKFEEGDIIDTDQGSYLVLNYYYTSKGILYNGWSEIEYLKGKKL